nr:hypothetical protein [Tanacetum cinerariifolium]
QLANIFTKALPADRFNYLVCRLGMRSLSPKELERLAKSHFFILASTTLRRKGDPVMLCIAPMLWSSGPSVVYSCRSFFILALTTPRRRGDPIMLCIAPSLWSSSLMIGFVLALALTVLGTCFSSLEVLEGLSLNIPGAITLSLFTLLDSCSVETEFEVTGFDKPFVLPILGRLSTLLCKLSILTHESHNKNCQLTKLLVSYVNPSTKFSNALPVKIKAPKELPKVSLVNESLKKLKLHLANFDKVVKIKTTPNARTKGEWGLNILEGYTEDLDTYDFDCDDLLNAQAVLMANISNYGYDVISEFDCKTILTKLITMFENAFKSEFKEHMQKHKRFNAQSFQDAMIFNMDSIRKYILEIILHQRWTLQLLKQKKLMQIQEDHSNPNQALNVDSLKVRNDTDVDDVDIRPIYDEEPMAKVQLTAECNIFAIGQQHTKKLEISNKAKIKKEIDVLETMNIELEHSVAKLLKENKTLKKHYKDLYDSIKITRSKTIEQTTSLLANNADLKAQIQEKVFVITALKNDLRKLKGNSVDTKFAKIFVLEKPVLQSLRNQSIVRQPNAFKSKRPQMSKPWFASQVNLSRPVTQHYLPKKRESIFVKPDHMIASSESRNSSKSMPRFSSNDMVHNYYLDEARKKTHERDRNSKIMWVPTGKICTSSTSKDDSKSTHCSNVDIPNIHESKKTLDLSAGTSINVQKEQSFDLSAELESLFGPSFDEYFIGENQVVSNPSVVTAVDASDKRQQQPDSTSSTSTLATTVTARELLHNITAQDTRERPVNVSFENEGGGGVHAERKRRRRRCGCGDMGVAPVVMMLLVRWCGGCDGGGDDRGVRRVGGRSIAGIWLKQRRRLPKEREGG